MESKEFVGTPKFIASQSEVWLVSKVRAALWRGRAFNLWCDTNQVVSVKLSGNTPSWCQNSWGGSRVVTKCLGPFVGSTNIH